MKQTRILAWLLCCVLCCHLVALSAQAAEVSARRGEKGPAISGIRPSNGIIFPPDDGNEEAPSDKGEAGDFIFYVMLRDVYKETSRLFCQVIVQLTQFYETIPPVWSKPTESGQTPETTAPVAPEPTTPPATETTAPSAPATEPPTDSVTPVQPTSGSSSQGSGLMTADDNDITGFVPQDWSWTAEGEGYGRKYFTSGKYVRDDGRAVLYIDSADSGDGFSYQLFVMADGAKQSNYMVYDYEYGTAYAWASNETEGFARDTYNGLTLTNYGNGLTVIASDWIDEMYYAYGAPDGYYYLVREKK